MAQPSSGSRIATYRDLIVWQYGMRLVTEIYDLTRTFPAAERFGLTAQLRRSAVSVPSNIAEGHCRDHLGDYLKFLSVAKAVLSRMLTMLSRRLRDKRPSKPRNPETA